MTAVTYPATLPNPSVASVTPAERRLLSDVTGGPQQARGVQRDYLGAQSIEWSLLSATDAAALDLWWKTTLTYGGAWFASTWPAPQGWVSVVRRFVGAPQWSHLPGGFWKVTATVQVRGGGMAPVAGQLVAWDPLFLDPTLTLSSSNFTVSASGTGATGATRATTSRPSGKFYFEVTQQAIGSGLGPSIGVCTSAMTSSTQIGDPTPTSWGMLQNGSKYNAGAASAYGSTVANGNIVMVAVDLTAGYIWWGVNGVWVAGGNPAAGTGQAFSLVTGTIYPAVSPGGGGQVTGRFRTIDFNYSQPAGFAAWDS